MYPTLLVRILFILPSLLHPSIKFIVFIILVIPKMSDFCLGLIHVHVAFTLLTHRYSARGLSHWPKGVQH